MMLKRKVLKLNEVVKIPTDYSLQKTGITQSLLSNFLCCKVRGILSLNRWTHASGIAKTRFGTIFHEILDKAYSSGKAFPTDKIDALIDSIEKARGPLFPGDPQARETTSGILSVVAEQYFKFYKDDFKTKKFTCVEGTKAVQFGAGAALLRGKIDGEYYDKDKNLWLMEHKTRGRIEEDKLMEHLSFDFQNLFYITIHELLHHSRVKGVLYNVVRTPGIRTDGKNLCAVLEKLQKDITADPHHYFKRWEIIYTDADKKNFADQLDYLLNDMEWLLAGKSKVYKNPFACETPFPCQFLSACASGTMNGYQQKKKLFEELEEV